MTGDMIFEMASEEKNEIESGVAVFTGLVARFVEETDAAKTLIENIQPQQNNNSNEKISMLAIKTILEYFFVSINLCT